MANMSPSWVTHDFAPIYDQFSRVLILGTIPSPKSREYGFYYGHPQNAFWRVIAAVFDVPVPETVSQKIDLLLERNIALWDVLKGCEILGADDGSIKNPVCNDFSEILTGSRIETVFTTGSKATGLYMKHCYPITGIRSEYLPSPSPANRRYYDFDSLTAAYKKVKRAL